VRAEEYGTVGRREFTQQLLDDRRRIGVEPVERLVEEQHFRIAQQCGADQHLLLHALGILAQARIRGIGDIEEFQKFLDPAGGRRCLQRLQTAHHREILRARQGLEQRSRFGHVADAPLHFQGIVDDVESGNAGGSAGRLDHPREDLDGGGLARPVGSEEAEHFAGCDRKVEPRHRDLLPVVLAEGLGLDHAVYILVLAIIRRSNARLRSSVATRRRRPRHQAPRTDRCSRSRSQSPIPMMVEPGV